MFFSSENEKNTSNRNGTKAPYKTSPTDSKKVGLWTESLALVCPRTVTTPGNEEIVEKMIGIKRLQ